MKNNAGTMKNNDGMPVLSILARGPKKKPGAVSRPGINAVLDNAVFL
jgi:hypothetical protein